MGILLNIQTLQMKSRDCDKNLILYSEKSDINQFILQEEIRGTIRYLHL